MPSILGEVRLCVKEKLGKHFQRCRNAGVRVRYLIVINLLNARSAYGTAEVLGVHNTTVYRVAKRFRQHGEWALWDAREDNGSTKLGERFLAILCDAVPRPQPLRNLVHDLKVFERALTRKTKVVFIANPNNPTGTMIPLSDIEAFLKTCPSHVLVVLDEAYYEYVDDPSYFESLKLLPQYPNLVVLRTFSKAFGLAGLRVGYGVGHPKLAEAFQKIREPFNVNALAMVAAEAALGDRGHVKKVVELNGRMRKKLFQGVTDLGLNPPPTQANFVYFEIPKAEELYQKLLKKGIIVRPMGPKALRVNTGTEPETERFFSAFQEVLAE